MNMGYIKNHSIIVNTYDDKKIKEAHNKAVALFGDMVTEIKQTPVNSDYSFAILPDGSKEGWNESDDYDKLRKIFKGYVKRQQFEDGSNPLKVVEIWFDEEDKVGIENIN